MCTRVCVCAHVCVCVPVCGCVCVCVCVCFVVLRVAENLLHCVKGGSEKISDFEDVKEGGV